MAVGEIVYRSFLVRLLAERSDRVAQTLGDARHGNRMTGTQYEIRSVDSQTCRRRPNMSAAGRYIFVQFC